MRLRGRLIATLTAVTVPAALFLVWLDATARHRAAEQMLENIVGRDLASQQDACERSPETWRGDFGPGHRGLGGPRGPPPDADGGPPPGSVHERPHRLPPGEGPWFPDDAARGPGRRGPRPIVVFAYDAELHAARSDAPAVNPADAEGLDPGDAAVVSSGVTSDTVDLLVRTPWQGKCAYVLARGTTSTWGAVLPDTYIWLIPTVVAVAVLLLALGPVVTRLRRLAIAVRQSAASNYEQAVVADGRDEIGELARAFAEAGAEIRARILELQRREQALRDFVANTTHDVMIPLTVLQGHLAKLRGDARDPSVAAAMNEAHYVSALLHNLGLAARLDSATPVLSTSRVDLNALMQRVASRHRPVAVEKGIAIELAAALTDLYATADVTLLEQAVSNIAYNAVRHGRQGGHVALIVEQDRDQFVLRILDDGPGIAPEQIAELMQRGSRGNEARNRDHGGQGLGLDIAAHAVALQGFTLILEPGEGGGLEARISGPLAAPIS